MSVLYERLKSICDKHGITGAELCRAIGYRSTNLLTELQYGRKKGISAETANKIAKTYNVSVAYILGEDDETSAQPTNSDEALMFALYGNDNKDITPAMLEDIRKFAQFVRQRDQGKEDDA